MSDPTQITRQWVSLPHGSCDARIGAGAVDAIGQAMRTTTSVRPRCAMVVEAGTDEGLVERVRRELTDTGYDVSRTDVPATADSPVDMGRLMAELGKARITSDDAVFALGSTRVLSLATAAAGAWCGGVPLTVMPLDEGSLAEAVVSPRWLSCDGMPEMVCVAPCARHVIADLDVMDTGLDSEPSRFARVLLAATAVAESEKSFSRLWDSADSLMSGDQVTLGQFLADGLKSRGHLVSSTALAIRQSTSYGLDFVRAMRPLAPAAPTSTLLAEGLRFAARLSAGMGKLSVDDTFAQDDLLAMLGLPEFEGEVDPEALCANLRRERFLRSNRFLFCLPLSLGRVRLTAVDEDLLRQHAQAWCDTHRP